ncbi:hypothetical protein HanRHA438_Chr10g0443511 [Helianthus annuus]|nr:hypothetical protein HanRHA438_Chr10g0443511 [Helianthus annuus]
MRPDNSLYDRFKVERNERLESCGGMLPLSLFTERSSDSRFVSFLIGTGTGPDSALWDRLTSLSNFRSPTVTGILPWKPLLEKSTEVKMLRIFSSSLFVPLTTTLTES